MRRRTVIALLGIAGALLASAWLGYTMSSSSLPDPLDVPRTDVTAVVERRPLVTEVVLRGTATQADPIEVPMPPVPAHRSDAAAVVTWSLEPGTAVAEGDVLVEVHGRPLIMLAGVFPLTRSIEAGDKGADVSQLQAALSRLGLDPGAVDGVYGSQTLAAVERLYAAVGYDPPEPTAAEVEAEELARDQHALQQRALDDAKKQLAEARTARDTQRSELEATIAALSKTISEARARIETLAAGLADARALVASLETEAVTAELVSARAAAADAETRHSEALAELSASETELADAKKRLDTLTNGDDVVAAAEGVQAAHDALEAAEEQLSLAADALKTAVSPSEFIVLPDPPYTVASASQVGTSGSESPVSLEVGQIEIPIGVPSTLAAQIVQGQQVSIQSQELGSEWTGTVGSVAASPVGSSESHTVVVVPEAGTEAILGRNVAVRFELARSQDDGLVVPSTAIWSSGTESRVTVVADDGSHRDVAVTVGFSTGGFTQVEAPQGSVSEGDRVLVGRRG